MPGFCNPMAFSIPDGVSAMRFGALPSRDRSVVPLVTMAPKTARSTCGASKPYPNVPEATSTGLRSRSPRPRSTLRSRGSAMELIRHLIPIDTVGPHARPILTGKKVAAVTPRCRAAEAGSDAAAHRRFERHLDGCEWNLLATCYADQCLEHRRGSTGDYVDTPHPSPPPKGEREIGQQFHHAPAMACAAVVGGDPHVGPCES